MKKAIGGVYVYNLVIVFLLIMVGFIMATLSYTKAFRVSKSIASIIERSSGYNKTSQAAISQYLSSIGYQKINIQKEKCPVKKSKNASAAKDGICIYEIEKSGKYITYGIVSYMSIDLPLIELVRVPIYIETEKIYIFE